MKDEGITHSDDPDALLAALKARPSAANLKNLREQLKSCSMEWRTRFLEKGGFTQLFDIMEEFESDEYVSLFYIYPSCVYHTRVLHICVDRRCTKMRASYMC